MPLTRIRLKNFKCFADSGDIPLAPLTVIFGKNNTGKSSILQSLLLLRQTLDSPEYGARLNLRGSLYAAGSFSDVVHQHDSKRTLAMQFGVQFSDEPCAGHLEMEFDSDEPQQPRLVRLTIHGPDFDSVDFRRGRGAGGPFTLSIGEHLLGGETEADFVFPVNWILPLIGDEPSRRGRPSTKRSEGRKVARHILEEVQTTLTDLKAVGAFRRQPDRRYEYQGRSPDIVDAKGEYVVNALIEDLMRGGRRRGTLFKAVNSWLKSIGRVRLLPLKRLGKSSRLFELRLKDVDSGRWAHFADVGFGIGQALPVFVEGLRTPAGGLFLVQEPEIHLHPDAQLQMADFLISLSRRGRRVVVETHSEHLLLRIRRRVAELGNNGEPLLPQEVSIIYVEKAADGSSRALPLDIDELGQIKNWPKGFMEEATEERLAIMDKMAARSRVRR